MGDVVYEDQGSAMVGVGRWGGEVVEAVVFCAGGGVGENVGCVIVVIEYLECWVGGEGIIPG